MKQKKELYACNSCQKGRKLKKLHIYWSDFKKTYLNSNITIKHSNYLWLCEKCLKNKVKEFNRI